MIRNQLTFLGNAGGDATTRQAGDKTVASVSVALSNGKDRDPTWVRAEAWGKQAERLATVKKGERIAGQGRLAVETYKDKDGVERTSVKVVVDNFEYLTPKADGAPADDADDQDGPF